MIKELFNLQASVEVDKDAAGLGRVISYGETPDVYKFYFVATTPQERIDNQVCNGKYVCVDESGGLVIGRISNLLKINEYFLNAHTLKENKQNQLSLTSIFPVDQWEYILCEVDVLGFYPYERSLEDQDAQQLKQMNFKNAGIPVSPGQTVNYLQKELLRRFLGFEDESGLNIGVVEVEDLQVHLSLSKLVKKHLAILAMSGAGKSYFTSILLEELIKKDAATPPVILIDTHGEYTNLLKSFQESGKPGADRISLINGSFMQIATPFLALGAFYNYMPRMSPVQGRELLRIFTGLKKKKKQFDLQDIIAAVESDENLGKKTKEALVGWLFELNMHGIFSKNEFPKITDLLVPNKIGVIDLSLITSSRHKQILVDYLANRAFFLRKNGAVPPFVLFLEEAHQFIPQSAANNAISRHTLEVIAREGRKFFASLCLISQRPVHLSTTVLSQCNTQIILRVSNPYDLDHIRSTSEKITSDSVKAISSLPVGHALVVGGAVNVPTFFKVRTREFLIEGQEHSMADELAKFL